MEINTLLTQLEMYYGPTRWQQQHDGLSELIMTILSHQTTDRNSAHAFATLTHPTPDWPEIHAYPIEEIIARIRVAGLAQRKAQYILTTLDIVSRCDTPYSIDFLATMPVPAAMQWLTSIPGIGPKTAACVLLFAFGRPVTPVDTHIARVCQRLQLVSATNAVHIQQQLESLVPDDHKYAFHIHMIQHGRRICHARKPNCTLCPLAYACPSALNNHYAYER